VDNKQRGNAEWRTLVDEGDLGERMRQDGLNTRTHTRRLVKCQGGRANGQDDGGRRDGRDGVLEVEHA
jgi:hypothetical protein